jgi:tRNA1(Val) A37 N6-methylase TrmN6
VQASRVIITGVRDSKKALKFNNGLILNNNNGTPTRRVENILRNGAAL